MDKRLLCQVDGSESLQQDSGESEEIYVLRLGGDLGFAEFEPGQWRLTVTHTLEASRQVSLGCAEAYLLECLIRRAGEMISRQELIDYAWRDRVVSQGSLNQAISNLRALLGDDQKREIILTIPRHGYQLNGDAIVSSEEWLKLRTEVLKSPASGLADPAAHSDLSPPSLLSNSRDWYIPLLRGLAGVLFITFIAGGLLRYLYVISPPYVMNKINTSNLQLTLIASSQQELQSTQNYLQPIFRRMESLGGGRAIVSRTHHYIELNCLRSDNTVYSLRVSQGSISSLEDGYLLECLK